jgi:uncharacterized protein YktA (UPF0223 family)
MLLDTGFLIIIILFLKARSLTVPIMDNAKSFKHSAEKREFERFEKRKQRARARVVKEVKTEHNEKIGGKQA